jgi:hypothetical protein
MPVGHTASGAVIGLKGSNNAGGEVGALPSARLVGDMRWALARPAQQGQE